MKKFFGILFLLIGLAMIVSGIAAITNVSTRDASFEGKVRDKFSHEYRSNNNDQKSIGAVLIGGGILFFVIGIIMVASKTSAQKRKEVELDVLKKMQPQNINNSSSENDKQKIQNLTNKVRDLFTQKDYHSAIVVLKQLLEITPDDNRRFVDLACLYSITNNVEAFNSLAKAIELGYNNFEKIKTDSHLEWLRKHPDYENFVRNGYKIVSSSSQSSPVTEEKKQTGAINDEIIDKLKKLSELKEQGILTEDEFLEQKRRILQ